MTLKRKASPRIADTNRSPSDRISTAETPMTMPASNLFTAYQMQGGEKLIRLPELLKTVGISRATAYRYVANGWLPKPVKLSSRCVAWKASAVNEWLAGLVAA